MTTTFQSIGSPGVAWGPPEIAEWRSRQRKQRSYAEDVVSAVERLRDRFDVFQYGELDYGPDGIYALFAVRNGSWHPDKPVVLVTGGVHGYETSGVHGALQFLDQHAEAYTDRINLLVAPCVSPWAYERINRWNPDAMDPNRAFRKDSTVGEASALHAMVAQLDEPVLVHIDLHETTDSDESEFRPALAARDGKPSAPDSIPDGFYLVDDIDAPQPGFQQAMIDAVAKVTHIAPADPDGTIIGSEVVAPGVIRYPLRKLGLCAGMTDARYKTTTEVYPDSPRATLEQCNAAQVAAVCAGIDYVLTRTPG